MKEIIVLGDIEMGAGNLTDDFISDRALFELITSLSKKKGDVDLVLNGDTFDFLKCPLIKNGTVRYPRHITDDISVEKLHSIYKAHTRVFEALRVFVSKKGKKIYFIIGNHDQDLYYKKVQRELKKILQTTKNVYFPLKYRQHRVHVEHGHQYDFLNKFNLEEMLINYKGVSILNMSWITFGIIGKFLHLKENHPFLERVKPYSALFSLYGQIVKKLTWKSFKLLLGSIVYYPFRYYNDPTYSIPRTLLRELYYRFKSVNWDVDDVVQSFKKTKKVQHNRVYVFSHVHQKYIEDNGDWAILQPDTWRDEYIVNPKTKLLTPKEKNYVRIVLDEDHLEWQMKVWPIKRKTIHFDDAVKNEMKLVRDVAKEEGYKAAYY